MFVGWKIKIQTVDIVIFTIDTHIMVLNNTRYYKIYILIAEQLKQVAFEFYVYVNLYILKKSIHEKVMSYTYVEFLIILFFYEHF